jgi:hypothetical protein
MPVKVTVIPVMSTMVVMPVWARLVFSATAIKPNGKLFAWALVNTWPVVKDVFGEAIN